MQQQQAELDRIAVALPTMELVRPPAASLLLTRVEIQALSDSRQHFEALNKLDRDTGARIFRRLRAAVMSRRPRIQQAQPRRGAFLATAAAAANSVQAATARALAKAEHAAATAEASVDGLQKVVVVGDGCVSAWCRWLWGCEPRLPSKRKFGRRI